MPVTQFGEEGLAGGWAYSKEEEQLGEQSVGADFAAAGHSHLITAHSERVADAYEVIGEVQGYAGIRRPFWEKGYAGGSSWLPLAHLGPYLTF